MFGLSGKLQQVQPADMCCHISFGICPFHIEKHNTELSAVHFHLHAHDMTVEAPGSKMKKTHYAKCN